MIARVWHGMIEERYYDEYTQFMLERAVPDYQSTKGYKNHLFLRRKEGSVAHFTLFTFWENLEVIKNFAGDDFEKAKYYPEDEKYLLEFEEKVMHHEVFSEDISF